MDGFALFIVLIFTALSYVILYAIIKNAVKNGINESNLFMAEEEAAEESVENCQDHDDTDVN